MLFLIRQEKAKNEMLIRVFLKGKKVMEDESIGVLKGITGRPHDSAKHPVVVYRVQKMVFINISDAAIVQELFTKHNTILDKHDLTGAIFKFILGNSFVFSVANAHWKEKRKACAHAFYKDRLSKQL